MANRHVLANPTPLVSGGNASSTITTPVTNIQFLDNVAYEVDVASGSPSGTISVQVSASYEQDNNGNVINAGAWTELTTATVTSGSPSPTYIDLNQVSAPWVRLVWTHTGGSGTLNIYIVGKEI